jgi:alpha-tubulin suppressor-like RCC1 family protein
VAGGLTFVSVTAGHFACALTGAGEAWCWGWQEWNRWRGQAGSEEPSNTRPAQVAGGAVFASLTAGGAHACGLTSAGAAYCWSYNTSGQLGDGSTTSRTTPVAVAGGITFASLTARGAHTCGSTSGGAAYCWGNNGRGQLGDGSTSNRTTPAVVASP